MDWFIFICLCLTGIFMGLAEVSVGTYLGILFIDLAIVFISVAVGYVIGKEWQNYKHKKKKE